MTSTMNFIFIDVWQKLDHPIEIAAKANILKFLTKLDRISNKVTLYHYTHNNNEIDSQVLDKLRGLNSIECNESTKLFQTYNFKNNDYFVFGGFHTNKCVQFKSVGINNLIRFGPPDVYQRCKILSDCTAGKSKTLETVTPYSLENFEYKDNLIDSHRLFNWLYISSQNGK